MLPPQQFVARSKAGLEVYTLAEQKLSSPASLSTESIKQLRLTNDGKRMAYALATEVIAYSWTDSGPIELCRVPVTCVDFVLSPSGRYMATFEKLQNDATRQHFNLIIWMIEAGGATKLGAFSHKAQNTWPPQWTTDESHFGRMTSSEVQFYKSEAIEKVAFRIQTENIGNFAVSPGSYPKAAVFIKEAKGAPAFVRVFLLPSTTAPVAQKAFFRADRCTLQWSPSGRHLLATSQTDVDSTGVSYYGETNLYFVSGDGSFDCKVDLDREGPIHDVTWSPKSDEFIVSYGYMPSKTMLFDTKCNPVFEFPVGSKNHVRWNPSGSLICFGGFGNLPGHVEVWSRLEAIRRVGHFQSQGSAICEWGPDGATIMTGVLTPRLRVDNNFKIWKWDGTFLSSVPYGELYHVAWRPIEKSLFPICVDLSKVPKQTSGLLNGDITAKKEVYRPPGLRSQPPKSSSSTTMTSNRPSPTLSKDEKVLKRLREKLDQISQLKQRHLAGEKLDANQLEKMKKEDDIREEYEKALIAQKSTTTAQPEIIK